MAVKYIRPTRQRGRPYRWHEIRETIDGWPASSAQLRDEIFDWVDANVSERDLRVSVSFPKTNRVSISFLFRNKQDAVRFKLTWYVN